MTQILLARITDSAPPFNPPCVTALRRICAWCVDFDSTAADNKGATLNIICPDCQRRVRDMARVR
jgi:hypothetical protein